MMMHEDFVKMGIIFYDSCCLCNHFVHLVGEEHAHFWRISLPVNLF